MEFKKFTSIENHYRVKYIDLLRMNGYENITYIVTEKIHGANFSFVISNTEVKVASRTQFVDGKFYGCQVVINDLSDKLLAFKTSKHPNADQITIFGELYGKGIQAGVHYSDGKEFRAFELQVDGEVKNQLESLESLKDSGIPVVPILAVYESLTEALNLSNTFRSYISSDTPKYNIAEGLVITPNVPTFLHNGSRVIIKSKTDKFTEMNKHKNSDSKPKEVNPHNSLCEPYININRLDAVTSKLGALKPKDFGRVLGLVTQDVLEEMIKMEDIPCNWKKTDNFKTVGKSVSSLVAVFLKKELLPKL